MLIRDKDTEFWESLDKDDELYHYGNANSGRYRRGSGKKNQLKALKRRIQKRQEMRNQKRTAKISNKKVDKKKTTDLSQLSTQEIQKRTQRMQAERNYYVAQKQLANSKPQKKKLGKAFVKKVAKDVVVPAATNVGRQYLENVLKAQLGMSVNIPKDKKK